MPPLSRSSRTPRTPRTPRTRRAAIALLAAAGTLGCGDRVTGPEGRADTIQAFEDVAARAQRDHDWHRSAAAMMALSALRLGAPLTPLVVTRNGKRELMTAVVARHDATYPDYVGGSGTHVTNVLAWHLNPAQDLLWVELGDVGALTAGPPVRGSYQSTENTGAYLGSASLMPGDSPTAAIGGPDLNAPAQAAVTPDGTTCDAIGSAADALRPFPGMSDCRGATFTVEFHAILYPEIAAPARPVTIDLGATRLHGVWFRLYCEGQSCPTQFPGGT